LFSNGTKAVFANLTAPSILKWTVVKVTENTVTLNVTLQIEGFANVIYSDNLSEFRYLVYGKSLILDVDKKTGEATTDNEKLGRVSFWINPDVNVGQKIKIATWPSDIIEGEIKNISCNNFLGRKLECYVVEVFNLDPFIYTHLLFERKTGLALTYTIVGHTEIVPGSMHTFMLDNGTVYNITSYARTKFAEKLGIEGMYPLTISDTNVEIGEREILPIIIYILIFTGLFILFIMGLIIASQKRRKIWRGIPKGKRSKKKRCDSLKSLFSEFFHVDYCAYYYCCDYCSVNV